MLLRRLDKFNFGNFTAKKPLEGRYLDLSSVFRVVCRLEAPSSEALAPRWPPFPCAHFPCAHFPCAHFPCAPSPCVPFPCVPYRASLYGGPPPCGPCRHLRPRSRHGLQASSPDLRGIGRLNNYYYHDCLYVKDFNTHTHHSKHHSRIGRHTRRHLQQT